MTHSVRGVRCDAGTIRLRTDADLAQAATALVEVHDHDGYPVEGVTDPVAWLTTPQPFVAWVAERDGEIVGHVAVSPPHGDAAVTHWLEQHDEPEEHVAVLGRLFVVPSARGLSLGTRLTQTATDYAHGHGLSLVLDVMAKDRGAIGLYERLGWNRMGQAIHHYGGSQREAAYTYAAPAIVNS